MVHLARRESDDPARICLTSVNVDHSVLDEIKPLFMHLHTGVWTSG